MNKKQYILSLIAVLFISMIIVSGSTFAYMRWASGTDLKTALNINVTEKINMRIDNPMDSKTGMYPTINCGGAAGMSFVSTVSIENQTGVLAAPNFKLKVKITDSNGDVITNNISAMDIANGTNNPYRYYINYVVTEENDICTSKPLYSGRFDLDEQTVSGSSDWYDSGLITLSDQSGFPLPSDINSGVSFNAEPYQTTIHKYKIWFWIDSSYTTIVTGDDISTDKMQNATIAVSFSENSSVEQKRNDLIAYAVYSGSDNSLRFYDTSDVIEENTMYNTRVATNVYKIYDNDQYTYDTATTRTTSPWDGVRDLVTKVVVEEQISPISTAHWFRRFRNTSSIDVTKLNTSRVTDMSSMFGNAGNNESVTTFTITGLNNLDTSKVTNMYGVFQSAGYYATTWNIGDLSNWQLSNVIRMNGMFYQAGYSASNFDIGNLDNWNVSNVVNMSGVFQYAGYKATSWNIGNLANWNVSNVTDMSNMFQNAAYSAQIFNIGNIGSWNVSNVKSTKSLFWFCGHKATSWNIGNLANWNVSNVTNMANMFAAVANNVRDTVDIGNLDNWNVSSVTTTKQMFGYFGAAAQNVNIGNLSKWNTSNVKDMGYMFDYFGASARYFDIGDLSKWNTSNVSNMYKMFDHAGANATNNWTIDLSNWNVSKVYDWDLFNNSLEDKIVAPTWITGDIYRVVYSTTDNSLRFYKNNDTITVGGTYKGRNVSELYTMYEHKGITVSEQRPWSSYENNITTVVFEDEISPVNTSYLFAGLRYVTNINISKLNTSNTTIMNNMFGAFGRYVDTINFVGLDTLNTSKVENMNQMFYNMGANASTINLGNIGGWNTSNVTDMYGMFNLMGQNSTINWTLNLSGWNVCKVIDYDSFAKSNGAGTIVKPNFGMSC